jgi:hypothetical protein
MSDEPSECARIYGTTNEAFLGDKRSGLSPITDVPKPYNSKTLRYLHHISQYQATYLEGFQTRDLQLIHPMLQRDKWETDLPRHLAFYPLGDDKTGFYVASNDGVWDALVPCLALASKFIDHFHLWTWLGLIERLTSRLLTHYIGGILSYSAKNKKSIPS